MAGMWHESSVPGFFATRPMFSFHELPEIHQEAPAAYAAAMSEIRAREMVLGAGWFRNNAEVAHEWWERKRPWWA